MIGLPYRSGKRKITKKSWRLFIIVASVCFTTTVVVLWQWPLVSPETQMQPLLLKKSAASIFFQDPNIERVSDRIRHGESLSAAFMRQGLSNSDIFQLGEILRKEINLRTIRPGDVLVVEKQPGSTGAGLLAIELVRSDELGVPVRYRVARTNSDDIEPVYQLTKINTAVTKRNTVVAGKIESSLYDGILYAGGDAALVNRFSDVFGWQLDFYRETQKGDTFKIIVEARFVEERFVGYGKVLAAEYNNSGRQYRGFHFSTEDGRFSGFFDEQGQALEKSFLRSPMELTRITSRYGQRFHPVLKQQKKHNGVDYGAPTGTPFWSIADGVVVEARYSPTAGRMIRISHRAGYITEYFHASRFAPGIKPGASVRQRQVIGYVGTTGRSTGPHLHFGMMLQKGYVDPNKQRFPGGQPIPTRLVKSYLTKVKPYIDELEKAKIS